MPEHPDVAASAAPLTLPPAPWTISAAQRALREGAITATGLLQQCSSTADALDEHLGVYLARFDRAAMDTAEAADRIFAAGDPAPPLLGIPLGIKDIISTREGPTSAQSLVLDPAWGQVEQDAPVVTRLRAAGAVITGKLTTMEFATGLPDVTKPFPVPRNPWDTDHWTGGSSSGTGSGVAVGAMLGGLGTDTGGSIRIPASFCGISGLKATFGRVPTSGCVPLGYSLDHIGPMARSARDCAIMLGALAGHHPDDPGAADEPVGDYLAGLTGDLTGLRVGIDPLPTAWAGERDPALADALAAVVDVLVSLGAVVERVELPLYPELSAATRVTSRSEAFAYHAPDLRSRWGDYFAATRQGVGSAVAYSGADYVQAQRVRRVGQKLLAGLLDRVDVVVTPTASVAAPRIDELADFTIDRFGAMHTGYWNAVGNPALSVPMGRGANGLPLGLQIAGRPFDEATVLKVGDAFQRATEWHLSVPPMAEVAAALR